MNIYEFIHLSAAPCSLYLSLPLPLSLLSLFTLHSPVGIHKTIFFMASMAYAVKAEPAENEALKGEGVKRSRKLYWPVDCSWREKGVHKGALLELSAIKYSRRQSRRQRRRCQSFRVYLHFYCRSVVKNLIKYHVIDPFSVMPAPGPSWSAARV